MPKPAEFHEAFARALAPVSPRVVTLDEAASTNDEARTLARDGAPHLSVVVANHQTAGRGRLGRRWESAPGAGLAASWVARPPFAVERWTLIPLFAGVAACDAIRARAKVEASLKWPNDLVTARGKLGGILVEAEPPAFAVVGLGVNVSHTAFPPGLEATSLALEGAQRLDRADLLAHALRGFAAALGDPGAALARYRELCATLGRRVRVQRRGGDVEGIAEDVDASGALVVDGAPVQSGDVVHLRPIDSPA
jgi:BirA family biotin operon repressor/biotin-[acetyl-CoA-carboxylase] ligase